MENLAAIPVFISVVKQGGISQAARALGISKSAVSKRISSLEDRLGARLLHRTTRRISLTEAGKIYFELAGKSLDAALEAENAVSELQGEPRGLLRINAPMSFGHLYLAEMIPAFLDCYPNLKIDLEMNDSVVDLVNGGYDLAVRIGVLENSSLIARKIASCDHILCASEAYLERKGKPSHPSELKKHNCLLYSNSSNGSEWSFISGEEQESVLVSGNYNVNNSEILRKALLYGTGIGRIPAFVVDSDLKSGKLIRLFDSYRLTSLPINVVFPERDFLPVKVRAFIDFSIDYFEDVSTCWAK